MLRVAIILFILALILGVLGFGGLAGGLASLAQLAFYVFIVLFLISLVAHLLKGLRDCLAGSPIPVKAAGRYWQLSRKDPRRRY